MDRNNEDLLVVICRIPQHADILKKLFVGNKEFRAMCEDYRKCHDALIYWSLMQNEESAKPRKQYAALLMELEDEIIQFLKENQ